MTGTTTGAEASTRRPGTVGSPDPRGACGRGEGGAHGGAPRVAGRPPRGGSRRPDRAAGGPGRQPGAGAHPDPVRADGGVAVRVLPRRGAAHGRRPVAHPELGPARPAVRRRPPEQLRCVRHAGAPARVRHQRLRRDPPRALRVGRQAAGREPGGRRPDERLHRARSGAESSSRPPPATARRCGSSPGRATSTSGTPTSTPATWSARDRQEARQEAAARCRGGAAQGADPQQPPGAGQAHRRVDGRARIVSQPPLLVPLDEIWGDGAGRRRRSRPDRAAATPTAARSSRTGATCWRSTSSSTQRARSWASAAWGPAPGSCC